LKIRQYYLLKLIEECSEVSQRAAKSMQFGADQVQSQSGHSVSNFDGTIPSEQSLSNRQRLSDELNDVLAVMYILQEDFGEVVEDTLESFDAHYNMKKEKIKKYLKFSQEQGMVEYE
jgi:NTP pyrophosphatase (non-canonical NTP hydrolase)